MIRNLYIHSQCPTSIDYQQSLCLWQIRDLILWYHSWCLGHILPRIRARMQTLSSIMRYSRRNPLVWVCSLYFPLQSLQANCACGLFCPRKPLLLGIPIQLVSQLSSFDAQVSLESYQMIISLGSPFIFFSPWNLITPKHSLCSIFVVL